MNKVKRCLAVSFMATVMLVLSFFATSIFYACGFFQKTKNNVEETKTQLTNSKQAIIKEGESSFQKIKMQANSTYNGNYTVKVNETSSTEGDFNLEISIIDANGKEQKYTRSAKSKIEIPFIPETDGEFTFTIRNNLAKDLLIEALENPDSGMTKGNENTKYKDYSFKAALFFSKYCTTSNSKYMTPAANANSTITTYQKTIKAADGRYFVQPLVFLGKIKTDKSVELMQSASIKIAAGGEEISLKPITSLAEDTLGDNSLHTTELTDSVRSEYAGFLGAAGEFYTLDTFRKLGDCDSAKTLALSADPGKDTVTINVVDASATPAINETIPVRVTLGAAISTYTSGTTKQSTWSLCSYNSTTGEPYNYTVGSGECEVKFSLAKPPSAKIDALPSVIYKGTATTASDPTRILFYGRSLNSNFIKAMIAGGKATAGVSTLDVGFSGCLYNGGLVSIPSSTEQNYLPVSEFKFQKGDIFSLGTRTGTYTAMPEFFQGDVVNNSTIYQYRNVPNAAGTLDWRKLKLTWTGCKARADSGVFAAAVGDYGIYPGDEGMYGVVTE